MKNRKRKIIKKKLKIPLDILLTKKKEQKLKKYNFKSYKVPYAMIQSHKIKYWETLFLKKLQLESKI